MTEWQPRGEQYLQGYSAAMEYIAEFVRDASRGSWAEPLMEVVASHAEEKAVSQTQAAKLDERLANALAKFQQSMKRSAE